jgi:Methyltransferase domain
LSRVLRSLVGRPAPALTPEQYWDSKYQVDEFIYTKVPNRFIVELCSSLTPGKAIDLAGGEGRNTIWLAEQGWQVENVDISRKGLEKCQEFAAERGVADRVRVLQASGESFRSSLAPVDLAIVPYLQIPAEQLEASFANLAEQVRRGGIVVGVWHSLDNLSAGFGGPQDPKVLPSVASMTATCKRIGLRIEVCENRDGQVQTKDGLKPSITLVLKAEVR